MQPKSQWQFWIDRGGTFTDIVARSPEGSLHTHKLLSENPGHYDDASIQGIRDLLGIEQDQAIPFSLIDSVKMGTTVATNALLERKGARTGLVITTGFKDALRIAYQNRPRLFDLNIVLPELLYEAVAEVNERIGARGEIHMSLDREDARNKLENIYRKGIRAVAIVLMHAYRYPQHEVELGKIAAGIGFTQISLSHEVSPLMKLVSRGDTTVVDAYLSPILKNYVEHIRRELGTINVMFMQSNGGLIKAELFKGKDSILSGPAGGIVGAARTCGQAGYNKIITFDMGGTSTDVAHFSGDYERTLDSVVAGVRIRAPMMQIHTVAAGGGSIISFDGGRFQVGPQSAGADPGPACYRRGGPLTVTDCNLLLGRLQAEYFPKVFGPNHRQALDPEIVADKFAVLTRKINETTGQHLDNYQTAEGFLKIAVDNMANAIKQISTRRGHDIKDYTLCCFGGAGGQHACRVAEALGMQRIVIHPFAGVLSAYGMGLADIRAIRQLSIEAELTETLRDDLQPLLNDLIEGGKQEITAQGIDNSRIGIRLRANIKYAGTDSCIEVALDDTQTTRQSFEQTHRSRYGFSTPEKPLIIESVVVEIIGNTGELPVPIATTRNTPLSATGETHLYDKGARAPAPVYDRASMIPGDQIDGPAVIIEATATTVVESGWQARCTNLMQLELSRTAHVSTQVQADSHVDPIRLEIFSNLFMSIAEQMGAVLANTSSSVNVKERLDFSCALFDCMGNLVANAPHIPVHMGSMGASVRAIIETFGDAIRPGDVFITNAPYNGGTHLPDITVVTPVFDSAERIVFFVGSRGHHADIGGLTPGSMPPDSTDITQEGVMFDNMKLVDGGEFQEDSIRRLLLSGSWPARNPDQNIADLKAQIAANEKGVQETLRMIEHFGQGVVMAYMQHVQDNAEESVRRVINRLSNGEFTYEVDEIGTIKVAVRVNQEERNAVIDFTGTSPQVSGNFNAPAAVCHAAILYVFRTLVDADIPLNEGCIKPLKIIIPEASMLDPVWPAAVVAGNVETSQWITNALYGALGVVAAAQGTMNNFTFGDKQYQYYETIGGGTGAGPDFHGCSAVQSHMTNSRLTDPEVLEWRYPVLLENFAIRAGSGGTGRYCGGDGATRRIRFLQTMSAAILSSHRRTPPFGIAGGGAGKTGKNYIIRTDGSIEPLKGIASAELKAGDVFVIETPGGGGYGQP